MQKSVNGMKFLPQAKRKDNKVAAKRAHFIGPLTIRAPKRNKATTNAPA